VILDASPLDSDPEGTALLRALIRDDKKARAARARPGRPEPGPQPGTPPARPAPLPCPAVEPAS
jgi:hypothetical protein